MGRPARTTLADIVTWLTSEDVTATRKEVEDAMRSQVRAPGFEHRDVRPDRVEGAKDPGWREGYAVGALWCKDAAQEAVMAGRLAGVWASTIWGVGGRGGSVKVLLPEDGMETVFSEGLKATLRGTRCNIATGKGRITAVQGPGSELEFRMEAKERAPRGWALGEGAIHGAFLCGTAGRTRVYEEDLGHLAGSMHANGNPKWYLASPPASWRAEGGQVRLAEATEGPFWYIARSGAYAKRLEY